MRTTPQSAGTDSNHAEFEHERQSPAPTAFSEILSRCCERCRIAEPPSTDNANSLP